MGFLQSLRVALSCLAANKLRSALTMFGVIIGVAAVIVMVSIVEGIRDQVVKEFEQMGSRLVVIAFSPEERKKGEGRSHVEFLTTEDAEAIQRECPLVERVSPEFNMSDRTFESATGEEYTGTVAAGLANYAELHSIELTAGRFFSEQDCDAWRKVCVVGSKVAEKLWPDEDPVGQTVRIHGISFTVIGIAKRQGRRSLGGPDPDRNIYAPITTLQKRIAGNERVWWINAQASDIDRTDEAADQIWALLMRRHGNQPDFMVDTQSRMLEAIGRILSLFSFVLGGVGGLALLVGGVGIMNIMLVSVTERTREIGLRKAVGAKRRHIMIQFLIESMTLSGIGGVMGVGAGAGLSWLVGAIMKGDMPTHVPVWVAVLGFCFACAVGIFFGLYPAWRAARLDPIQALRYE
ncbi:MAG: ABC transporter permease [Armatimonadota bacterium]|nr:ABC transporter permease [Armatimonadota bacterium]